MFYKPRPCQMNVTLRNILDATLGNLTTDHYKHLNRHRFQHSLIAIAV